MNYKVRIVKAPLPIVRVRGEVMGEHGQKLSEALAEAFTLAAPDALIDLAGVTFIDSSGLGLLMHTWKTWESEKRRLIFLVPDGFVRSMFEETNLTRQFHCISSMKEL
jgi:anti-anti-sigma factor